MDNGSPQWLISIYHLQIPCFQIKSHSQILGGWDLNIFWGDTNSTHNNPIQSCWPHLFHRMFSSGYVQNIREGIILLCIFLLCVHELMGHEGNTIFYSDAQFCIAAWSFETISVIPLYLLFIPFILTFIPLYLLFLRSGHLYLLKDLLAQQIVLSLITRKN